MKNKNSNNTTQRRTSWWKPLALVAIGAFMNNSASATTCAGAINIPSAPVVGQAMVCGATNDMTSANTTACGSGSYKGGWEAVYTFTPPSSATYNVAYTGQTWTGIFVYAGCPTSGGTCIGNITSSGSSKNLNVALTGSVQYFIVFDTYPTPNSPCAGTFSLTPPAPPPPGNDCGSAIDLAFETSPIAGNTAAAGTTDNFNIACASNTANDLVYYIDVAPLEEISFTNTTPGYDSKIAVHYGAVCPGTTLLWCWDDADDQTNAWTNTTGLTQRVYWVQDGYLSGSGTFTLAWTLTPAPSPCAAPTPGATTGPATACSAVNFDLGLTNATPGVVVSYQWYADDGTGFVPVGTNLPTLTISQTVATDYYCDVTCSTGPNTVSSGVWSVGMNAPATCYCDPVYTTGKTDGDLISNVEIVGTPLANNTGTAAVNPAYTYFTGMPNYTATLQAGSSYTMNVSVGTYGSQNMAVWIDYDDDGVFATPSERVGYTGASINGGGSASFAITLGCSPSPGVHRMRVRDVYFTTGSSIDPCASYGYGETEDYDVTIAAPPPCPTPSALVPSNATTTSTDLTWTVGCTETAWEIEYGSTGFTVGTGTTVPAGTNPYTLGSLSPSTTYDVYLRADCGGNGLSASFGPVSVTTLTPPPVNDECANAIPLDCNTFTTGTTTGATLEVPAPAFCGTGLTAPGVWYTLAGFDGPMFATLCGSTAYDTKINVYTGSCGAWVCVGGNDDNFNCTSNTASSRYGWTGSSADTYYILVQGYGSETGDFDLFVGCGSNNNSCPDNGVSILFQTDASPGETTWDLLDGTGQYVVVSGGPLAAPGALLEEFACVPDGCYQFRVNDVNGMSSGGYIVRTQGSYDRIIDDMNNFSSGPASQASGSFCLPLGTTDLLYSSCDKYFWATGEYIVCNEDAAVASDWNGGGAAGADSGYDFWFYNPNGGYSYVRSRRHNVSDNYANVGSSRTCHMKINNWAAVNHIPDGVLMNVRVRAVVNGVAGAYGPACRFTRDEATAACPPTLLFDVPGFPQFYSCGVNRDFVSNTANRLYARPVSGATQYRFTFDNAELASPIVRTANNYFLSLGWSIGVAPPLVGGQTYDVTVEAFKGGNWCIPGNVCLVTINNPVAGGQQSVALDGGSALNMWPNPSNGDVLNMSLLVADPFITSVSMDIFDLSGKRMIARTVGIQDGLINTTIDLNGGLADGMYMVKVTAGEEVFTQRVVIQK